MASGSRRLVRGLGGGSGALTATAIAGSEGASATAGGAYMTARAAVSGLH